MSNRIVRTNKQLAAERQIHAAIVHFRTANFECAISLCSAAEGQMPEPDEVTHFFAILKKASAANPPPEGRRKISIRRDLDETRVGCGRC